ncbi:MAG: aminoglycoside phosphotransferase family protein [Planctomycetes bacterium]|nr:aminoglycoside phosphotransferase family protein [Planctomycetota bacterium]
MLNLDPDRLKRYLESVLHETVRVLGVDRLGEPGAESLKTYGYGIPLRIRFELSGRPHTAVLETVRPGPFGHEHMSDRAQMQLWAHAAYNRLPRHVRSIDVGAFERSGRMVSLGDVDELFVLTEFVEGRAYAEDLQRLMSVPGMSAEDGARSQVLCDYLADIHSVAAPDRNLYFRRLRELLGHGEGIMGIADQYPSDQASELEDIEHRCLAWRWKLKPKAQRLRQVHGDFHPWNILFRQGTDFTVLDRSRGEWGEPADDVTSLTLNYLFFSIQRAGRLEGDFEALFRSFWDRYIEKTGDAEILNVAPPFFAFRGLVVACPKWYPNLPEKSRRAMLAFVRNVLDAAAFEPHRVNSYCEI